MEQVEEVRQQLRQELANRAESGSIKELRALLDALESLDGVGSDDAPRVVSRGPRRFPQGRLE